MKSTRQFFLTVAAGGVISAIVAGDHMFLVRKLLETSAPVEPISAALVLSPFAYDFPDTGTLEETGGKKQSADAYWHLSSGGRIIFADKGAETVQGALLSNDFWRLAYAESNPRDTDGGYRPQNIFRLESRSQWRNVTFSGMFEITADNWSDSPGRNSSNGLLLMMRYEDSNNLYYAGIRVDGNAVIKKKRNGVYYTLAEEKLFPGTYTPGTETNLLPHYEWFGLKSDIYTAEDGATVVSLYLRRPQIGSWVKILSARDYGEIGGPVIEEGAVGIRTDFMDVKFSSWKIESF